MFHRSSWAARPRLMPLIAALSWAVAACVATTSTNAHQDVIYVEEGPNEVRGALAVPPGHLPPPGACRIWFPGRPPGRQPHPLDCGAAMANAPAGSWVLYRPDREEVHARVIDARRPGAVIRVQVYSAESGRYLRTERAMRER